MPRYKLPPFDVQQRIQALSETRDWSHEFFGVAERHKLTQGEGVTVAVLDTGCDMSHPDLREAIVGAKDFTGSRHGVQDINGHGTHVAGIIGARVNGIGIIGVAPKCRLLIGKVLGDDGTGSGAAVAAGIRWAVAMGAKVINLSLGGPQPDRQIAAAIIEAVAAGVFVICAAGNSGRANDVNFPARYTGRPQKDLDTIAVAAVGKDGKLMFFSSRGPEVDIAGPGGGILSCWLNGQYAALDGTSMAAPFVSGCVVLLIAWHAVGEHATPLATMEDLREHLQRSATEAGAPGRDHEYGFGLIGLEELLKLPVNAVDEDEDEEPVFTHAPYRLVVMKGADELASFAPDKVV